MSLQHSDITAFSDLGKKLKSILFEIVQSFPRHAQSISGMSEHLNYNKSNCQRIINAIKSSDGIKVLCALPGIAGLTDFCSKSSAHISEAQSETLATCIVTFQQKMKLHARSHSELKRLLSESSTKVPLKQVDKLNQSQLDKRAKLFYAAKDIVSASVDTMFCSYILSNNLTNNNYLQEIAMISKLGVTHEKNAQPFVQFYTHPHPDNFTKPYKVTSYTKINSDGFSIGVVDEYSSQGLLEAYSSYSASNSGIVFKDFTNHHPFDATFLFNNPDELANPITHQSHCSSTSISIKNPTKKLVMLVFLDKQIDMRSTVNVGCYQGNQKVEDGHLRATDMWTERLPEFPQLTIVNLLSPNITSSSELNIVELTDYQFNFSQLNKQDFVCYMMEIDYPIWSSTYRIYFEHS